MRGLALPPYPAAQAQAAAAAITRYGKGFMLENVLSPDQALYCGPQALAGKGGEAGNEVLTALFYILDCIKTLKFTPRFLSKQDVAYFDTMKSGRYSRKYIEEIDRDAAS